MPRSRWKRVAVWAVRIAVGATLVLIVRVALWEVGQRPEGLERLRQAQAELDRNDPGWRLDEIEAARAIIPDAENSAALTPAIFAKMPTEYPKELFDTPYMPPEQLPPETILIALRSYLDRATEAVTDARTLTDRPRGRFAIRYQTNPLETLLTENQNVRMVADLLQLDAMRLAQDGDGDAALRSCRAIANAGEAFHDEPLLISQLLRIAIRAVAYRAIERTLAQTEPGETALADAQALLQRLESLPTCQSAVRGERALHHTLLTNIANGSLTFAEVASSKKGESESVGGMVFRRYRLPGEHVAMLDWMTAALRAFDTGGIDGKDQLEAVIDEIRISPHIFVRLLFPTLRKVHEADVRGRANMRVHIHLLAAERYRRDIGRLPGSAQDLIPKFLPQWFDDPFDVKPLRFCSEPDRLIIYSVGPDRVDDGGAVGSNRVEASPDIGCVLWDVPKRRQPAPPPKPEDQP